MITLGGREFSCNLHGRVEMAAKDGGLGKPCTEIQHGGGVFYVQRDQIIDATTEGPPGGWNEWTPKPQDSREENQEWLANVREQLRASDDDDEYGSPQGCSVTKQEYPGI